MPDLEMLWFYDHNRDFHKYVNKNAQTYHKSPAAIMDLATTRRVYEEMQKGGCNESKQRSDI